MPSKALSIAGNALELAGTPVCVPCRFQIKHAPSWVNRRDSIEAVQFLPRNGIPVLTWRNDRLSHVSLSQFLLFIWMEFRKWFHHLRTVIRWIEVFEACPSQTHRPRPCLQGVLYQSPILVRGCFAKGSRDRIPTFVAISFFLYELFSLSQPLLLTSDTQSFHGNCPFTANNSMSLNVVNLWVTDFYFIQRCNTKNWLKKVLFLLKIITGIS